MSFAPWIRYSHIQASSGSERVSERLRRLSIDSSALYSVGSVGWEALPRLLELSPIPFLVSGWTALTTSFRAY